MNKILSGIIALSLSAGALHAATQAPSKIVSIDSVRLMQESKEGQALFAEFEAERNKAVTELQEIETDAKKMVETLQKQQALLSADALREKRSEIERKEKQLTRKRDQIAEDLNTTFQGRQEALFTKQMSKARTLFTEQKGAVLLDKRTPGVLAISEDLDMTDDVLKLVNVDFDAEQKKNKKSA